MLEVGTGAWAQALREAANAHSTLRELGASFSATFGLAFLADDAHPERRVVVRIVSGVVVEATVADPDDYAAADLRLSATCDAWGSLLQGVVEPLRALMAKRIATDGERLLLLRGLPTAKALILAARELDAEFAVQD